MRGDIGWVARAGPEGSVAMGWSPLAGGREASKEAAAMIRVSEHGIWTMIVQGGGGGRHVLKIEPRGRGDGLNKRIRMPRVLFGDAE